MVLLILAAIIGSMIGFAALLPLGLLPAFGGLVLGGSLAILLAGLLMATMRKPAVSANPFTAKKIEQTETEAKVHGRSRAT